MDDKQQIEFLERKVERMHDEIESWIDKVGELKLLHAVKAEQLKAAIGEREALKAKIEEWGTRIDDITLKLSEANIEIKALKENALAHLDKLDVEGSRKAQCDWIIEHKKILGIKP